MSRHETDVVGFFFGITFLVCAGLAIGVRTGNLGIGSEGPDGAWIAGTVLALAGVIGIVGTLSNLRRRAAHPDAAPPATADASTSDLPSTHVRSPTDVRPPAADPPGAEDLPSTEDSPVAEDPPGADPATHAEAIDVDPVRSEVLGGPDPAED